MTRLSTTPVAHTESVVNLTWKVDMSSKICPQCGIEFTNKKHPNSTFCSQRCFGDFRKRVEHRPCVICGTVFDILPSSPVRTCSKPCESKHRSIVRTDPSNRVTKPCDWCGKEFTSWKYRNGRFCSHQCTSEFATTQSPKGIAVRRPENYVTIHCEQCSNEYIIHKTLTQNGRQSRFCSAKCRDTHNSERMRGNGNPNYIGGTQFPDRGENWSAQRKKAFKRDGGTCQICKRKQKPKEQRVIHVHHIIPYKAFEGDYKRANRLSNLITLCRKCHSKVEHGKLACPRRLFS